MLYKILLLASIFLLMCGSLACGTPTVSIIPEREGVETSIVTATVTQTVPVTHTQNTTVTATVTATETIPTTVTQTVTVTESPVLIRVKRQMHGNGQIVTLNMETEYLPVVVACENKDAPYESLKAQAIASRTFAIFKKLNEPRNADYDILDYEADQVYNPATLAALPSDKQTSITQAVKDTKGLAIWYNNNIICSFYVSGTGQTLQYVTFNEGKSGNAVNRTTLDGLAQAGIVNPYNRGCMGQVQANALALQGYDYQRILHYFYGADITIESYPPGS